MCANVFLHSFFVISHFDFIIKFFAVLPASPFGLTTPSKTPLSRVPVSHKLIVHRTCDSNIFNYMARFYYCQAKAS